MVQAEQAVTVCLCDWAIAFEIDDFWPKRLACWFTTTLHVYGKFEGQGHRYKVMVTGVGNILKCSHRFLHQVAVVCDKMVGLSCSSLPLHEKTTPSSTLEP